MVSAYSRCLLLLLALIYFAVIPRHLFAQEITESHLGPLSFSLVRDGDLRELTITLKSAAAVSVFPIENPARIVVDIEGLALSRLPALSVAQDAIVHGVRLGIHPGKLRIVLDLAGNAPPPHSWELADKKVTIRIGPRAAAAGQPDATSTPHAAHSPTSGAASATPVPQQVGTVAVEHPHPSAIPTLAPSVSATHTPHGSSVVEQAHAAVLAPPTSGMTPTTAPSATEPRISSLRFYKDEQGRSLLSVGLFGRTPFRLARLDQKTYRMTLTGVTLAGPHLLLPLFPPNSVEGFTHCLAKSTDDGTEIVIGVDRGARAEATSLQDAILVTADLPLPPIEETQETRALEAPTKQGP